MRRNWIWGLLAGMLAQAGCKQDPPPAPAGERVPVVGETVPDSQPAPEEIRGADEQDDPAAPRALPRSNEVQGWIKKQAVQVTAASQPADFAQDPAVRRVVEGCRINRLARCAYQAPHAKVIALFLEAASPADAFSAFSVLAGGAACTLREDGSLRATEDLEDQVVMTAWQGNAVTRFYCTFDQDEGRRDCDRLLNRTVFGLPMADPPLLARAVREVKTDKCNLWVVRSATLLARSNDPVLDKLDPKAMDSRLGLTGQALLSVVVVQQSAASPPIVLWAAEYPSAAETKAAAERYRQATQPAPTAQDEATFIGQPRGTCLIGTWTNSRESRDLVNMLEQALPES
jgi:hypothetical protein